MRLGGGHRLHTPVTPRRVFPVDGGGPLPDLAIPAADQALVVSIVVPVLSNAFLTHYCLSCIVESTEAGTFEVIVVDNGSDTRTREMLARVAGVTLIVERYESRIRRGLQSGPRGGAWTIRRLPQQRHRGHRWMDGSPPATIRAQPIRWRGWGEAGISRWAAARGRGNHLG